MKHLFAILFIAFSMAFSACQFDDNPQESTQTENAKHRPTFNHVILVIDPVTSEVTGFVTELNEINHCSNGDPAEFTAEGAAEYVREEMKNDPCAQICALRTFEKAVAHLRKC